jgi:hypothetical protein
MSLSLNPTVYARVQNGKILEYPVYPVHITNRAHPLDWYTPVLFTAQPDTDEFHYAREVLSVTPDQQHIVATYTIEPYTLDSLFQRIPLPEGVEPELPGLLDNNRPTEPPTPELVARIQELILERVQSRLDNFARTRGYDGILSACSYIGSTNPKFKAEAEQCVQLRDATWTALYSYISELNTGTEPLPYQYEQVEAKLPRLSWND